MQLFGLEVDHGLLLDFIDFLWPVMEERLVSGEERTLILILHL